MIENVLMPLESHVLIPANASHLILHVTGQSRHQ
jgi:hypothetical protein